MTAATPRPGHDACKLMMQTRLSAGRGCGMRVEAVWTVSPRCGIVERRPALHRSPLPKLAHATCADPATAAAAAGCSWNELKPEGATALATPLELLTGLTPLDLKWGAAVA